MSDFVIKVSPEVMISQANLVSSGVDSIRRSFEQITRAVYSTREFWEGEASELHIRNYSKLEPKTEEALKRLKEHPTDLLKMADIYKTAESKSAQTASALPSNVIS
ncbi:MAG: hypothetical protein IIU14_03115 [Ruminococcus sp.]|nr:hypothetical protein [Ruminococcus sp.]